MIWHLTVNIFFSVSSVFEKDAVFQELNSLKYISPDAYRDMTCGQQLVVKWKDVTE